MDVNYILIKGNKHFKCHSLAEMAIYFSLSVTSNGSVICDGYHDTMSYSKEWSHEDIITDFIRNRVEKVVPDVKYTKYKNNNATLNFQIMATKSIDKKKTLEYAVAFYFYDSGCVNFMMGNIMYQHIKTIYDERADGRGQNTLEVVYNYKKMKYEVLSLTDSKLAQKEISIL